MRAADLEEVVVPVVASSAVAAKNWATPLAMVFVDGGHSLEAALSDYRSWAAHIVPGGVLSDYRSWAAHIVPGGVLAIHDIFPDPAEGGQAPYEIYKFALASGLFQEIERVKTLGLLRRI
jgi:hypothetical protein